MKWDVNKQKQHLTCWHESETKEQNFGISFQWDSAQSEDSCQQPCESCCMSITVPAQAGDTAVCYLACCDCVVMRQKFSTQFVGIHPETVQLDAQFVTAQVTFILLYDMNASSFWSSAVFVLLPPSNKQTVCVSIDSSGFTSEADKVGMSLMWTGKASSKVFWWSWNWSNCKQKAVEWFDTATALNDIITTNKQNVFCV